MATKRARKSKSEPEVSNYDIVNHWFDLAADRMELRDDIREVVRSSLPRGAGAGPGHARRREDPRLQRLPRPAQRRARALQGRHPLPPRGRPRRGARARHADDVEDRGRRDPVRRRQGRRELRPARARRGRAAADHALVHRQDREGARPAARHPRARRRHQRPDDGLDDGRVRQAARPHAGDRDRQADLARGLLRPRGGHRPRHRPHVPRGRAGARAAARRVPRRAPGLRQRRLVGGAHHRPARLHGDRRSPTPTARVHAEDGLDPEALRRARARGRQGRASSSRRRGDHARGAARARVRGVHPRGARRHDQRRQRRPAQHAHASSRARTPRPPRRPTRSSPTRASTSCPT